MLCKYGSISIIMFIYLLFFDVGFEAVSPWCRGNPPERGPTNQKTPNRAVVAEVRVQVSADWLEAIWFTLFFLVVARPRRGHFRGFLLVSVPGTGRAMTRSSWVSRSCGSSRAIKCLRATHTAHHTECSGKDTNVEWALEGPADLAREERALCVYFLIYQNEYTDFLVFCSNGFLFVQQFVVESDGM